MNGRIKVGRKPSPGGPKVMIPWRISPRLIERIKWQSLKQNISPAVFLTRIIERNAPPY